MDFQILKSFNDTTSLVLIDNQIRVVKEILPIDKPVFNKLIKIDCKNLARVYDIIDYNEKCYVVQEFVQGSTLEEYLKNKGTLPIEEVKSIATAVCNGLEALHGIGLVHRDVNPNNIILGENDVKLIDFGISRIVKHGKSRDTQILGTQGYASPEQFGFSQTGPKADIYSVGVLMNFMLTGAFPYEKLANNQLTPIIQKCIQIDEIKRYDSAKQLKNAINKMNLRAVLSKVPGFRTNKWYKKIIASIYYIVSIFCACIICIDINSSAYEVITNLWFCIFFFFVPVPLLTDLNNWSKKLFPNTTKNARTAYKIIGAVISVVISFIFVIITPNGN